MTIDITRLRELLDKATPGPWGDTPYQSGALRVGHGPNCTVADIYWPAAGDAHANAALIAEGINALPALLDEVERTRWQPIETAPRDGTDILVWFKHHGAVSVRWTDRDDNPQSEWAHWCVDDNKHGPYPLRGYCEGDDTHWMPLPAPPAALSGPTTNEGV